MRLVANQLVFSPTDLTHFLACEYLSRLEIEVANGRVLKEYWTAEADLLAAKGDAHERAQVEQFERRGLHIVRIGEAGAQFDWDANAPAERTCGEFPTQLKNCAYGSEGRTITSLARASRR